MCCLHVTLHNGGSSIICILCNAPIVIFRCVTPYGVGSGVAIRVVASTLSSVYGHPWSYDAPMIASVTPPRLHPVGGDMLSIRGVNFGWSPAVSTVTVGGRPCVIVANETTWQDDAITCISPVGVSENASVTVMVAGLVSAQTVDAHYHGPTVTSMAPIFVGTAGGDVLVINGTDFATRRDSGTDVAVVLSRSIGVSRSSIDCSVIDARPGSILCAVPEGSGTGWAVTVSNVDVTGGGRRLSAPAALTVSYRPPTVTALAVIGDHAAMAGGFVIRVEGLDLSTTPVVYVGELLCGDVVVVEPHVSLQCRAPPGRVGVSPSAVRVEVDGQWSHATDAHIVTYDGPTVSLVTPSVLDAVESTSRPAVTISGVNFGLPVVSDGRHTFSVSANHTITVGGVPCDRIVWTSDSTLQCHIGGVFAVGRYDVVVSVGGVPSASSSSSSSSMPQPEVSTVRFACGRGYYGTVGELCRQCPEGGVCEGGDAYPVAQVGYYPMTTTSFVQCVPVEACLGGSQAVCAQWYTGYRCADCDVGGYRYCNGYCTIHIHLLVLLAPDRLLSTCPR